jgi:hypothetical protein
VTLPSPTAHKAAPPKRAMSDELERFKRDVNLTELAASLGYRLVDRERSAGGKWHGSSQASVSMRNPDTDDKIIIRRDRDGHWTYFSVRDDRDNGTVVDFVQRRGQPSLGAVRKELRLWLGVDRPRLSPQLYRRNLKAQVRDPAAVNSTYASAASAPESRYLAGRGVRSETLRDKRFAESFRVDARGNVLFGHLDPSDPARVVGFEIKNNGFTGFATGGRKTFWRSATRPSDNRLVIVEASIDGLSYHQLFPHPRARYLSTGGAVGADQLEIVAREIATMPPGSEIVLATDNDAGGDKLASQLVAAAGTAATRRHFPPAGKDWNDYLQSLERTRPHRREHRLER